MDNRWINNRLKNREPAKKQGKKQGTRPGGRQLRNRSQKLTRKQVVWLEWAAIFLAVAVLAGIVSFFIFRKNDSNETVNKETSEAVTVKETFKAKHTYQLSFAGDCTIGSLLEWQGSIDEDFHSVVGDDYAYPFSGVRHIFEADDFTVVNFEGTLTTAVDAVEKPYRFKADPAYAQVLTEGCIDAVSLANNHTGDFKEQGRSDTMAALDSAGILYAQAGAPLICTLDGGLKIGIAAYNTVDNDAGEWTWRSVVQEDIERCKQEGCELIIGFMHWGSVEYLTEPEAWEVQFARDMVDWGCDLIVGGHAHILQRMEYYNNVPIFYSMGNFCFGGNTDPDDKDSVIVQAEFEWEEGSDTVTRTGLSVIPCMISSTPEQNDYCPTPCEEGSSDWQRILEKLEWKG